MHKVSIQSGQEDAYEKLNHTKKISERKGMFHDKILNWKVDCGLDPSARKFVEFENFEILFFLGNQKQ